MSRPRRFAVRALLVASITAAASGAVAIPAATAAPAAPITRTAPTVSRPPSTLSTWIAGTFYSKEYCEQVGADGVRNQVWSRYVCYHIWESPGKEFWVLQVEKTCAPLSALGRSLTCAEID
jgi:hypothetical protein